MYDSHNEEPFRSTEKGEAITEDILGKEFSKPTHLIPLLRKLPNQKNSILKWVEIWCKSD